jgi:putative transposase
VGEGEVVAEAAAGVWGAPVALLGQHLWARGYFCASSGTVADEMIKAYLEGHQGRQSSEDFKVEMPD